MKKSIIHVEDHLIFAEGIKLLFEGHPYYDLVHHFKNTTDALSYCKYNMPDMLLMDYYLPEGDGLEAVENFLKLKKKPSIIFLTMLNDGFIIQAAKTKGIHGFLSKNIGHKDLFLAIDAVFKGETCFPEIREKKERSNDLVSLLSNREKQIARLVAQGYSSTKIANELFISELTVSTHRKNILRKLNLKNSVQLGSYIHLFH
jgi:DNA-binding NarL/FixJ family response regulator